MTRSASVSLLGSEFEGFLFAPIGEDRNETPLSVLSALARLDVDPWEEAARLATLSTSDAERSLVSTLNIFPGHPQSSPESETLAARLVALLPKARAETTAKVTTSTGSHNQRTNYWLVWLCFGIIMSFLTPRQPATTTAAGSSASASNTASPIERRSAEAAPSDANGRTDAGEPPLPTIPPEAMKAR